MGAFESGVLDLPNFYFTGDDYRYRFERAAKQRFIDLIRERFNAGVTYHGRVLKWDTAIERKAIELGRYLCTRSPTRLDFFEPAPILRTRDDPNIRQTMLNLTQAEARRLGIEKSTLHYLRKRADHRHAFTAYSKTLRKLETEEIRK
jgi:hypothetical protein